MTAPSISFDDTQEPPLWRYLTVKDVERLLCDDVAELNRLRQLRAEDEADALRVGRFPDRSLTVLIDAWESAQDAHWSWLKELQNAPTRAAFGFETLGNGVVGAGN